jgi:hypothetical protein
MWHKSKKLMARFQKDLCEHRRQCIMSVEGCVSHADLESLTLHVVKAWIKNKNKHVLFLHIYEHSS